ncbi:Uncharacterised protein [Yersinia enterocolitica]|nr:Uncharacterised protein [Yersinia enterocolitica]
MTQQQSDSTERRIKYTPVLSRAGPLLLCLRKMYLPVSADDPLRAK